MAIAGAPEHPVSGTAIPYVARRPTTAGPAEVLELAERLREHSVVLVGEPGAGASRLAREVYACDALEPLGALTATVSGTGVPLAAFVALETERVGAADWHRLRERLEQRLTSRNPRPPVLLVDDAHLLDDDSATLLHHLVSTERVRMLATMPAAATPPGALLTLIRDDRAQRVPVLDFDEATTARFTASVLGRAPTEWLCRELYRHSAGNVRLLSALLHSELITAHPEDGIVVLDRSSRLDVAGLRASIEVVRPVLADLSPAQRSTLELLALTEGVRWVPAQAAFGLAMLSELERSGAVLITEVDGSRQVRVRQPLVAELLRAEMPVAARVAHRLRLSAMLRAEQPTPQETVQLACWAVEDHQPLTEDALTAGAVEACRQGQAEPARLLVEDLDRRFPSELSRCLIVWSHLLAGEPAAALETLDTLAGARGDGATGELAARLRITAAIRADRVGLAQDLIADPGDSLTPEAALELRMSGAVMVAANDGDFPATIAHAAALGPNAGRRLPTTPLAWALLHTGDGPSASEPPDRRADGVRNGERSRHRFEAWAAVRVHGMSDWDEVGPVAHRLLGAAVDTGDRASAGSITGYLGLLALLRGDPRRATDLLREAIHHLRYADPGLVRGLVEAWLVLARAHLGVADTETLAAATEHLAGAPGWLRRGCALPRAMAWLAAARGDLVTARGTALSAAARMAGRSPLDQAILLHEALRLGSRDPRIAATLTALEQHSDLPAIRLRCSHARLLDAGDTGGLLELSRTLERRGALLWAAETAAQAGEIARERHDAATARRARGRSRLLIEHSPGAITPALDWQLPAPLTERQRDVAYRAAHGHTNAEIAQALGLSVRTVESHLFRGMRRLGVTRRDQLAQVLPATRLP